jgi:hypothetical protein
MMRIELNGGRNVENRKNEAALCRRRLLRAQR